MAVGTDDGAAIISELHVLSTSLNQQVQKARASRDSYSIHEFINSDRLKEGTGLCVLYPVQEYVRCFRALVVKNREELDKLLQRHYGEPSIRDAVEEFLQSEEEFGKFVTEIDAQVKASEDQQALHTVLGAGSQISSHLELLDADTNCIVPLGEILDKTNFTLFVFKRHYV